MKVAFLEPAQYELEEAVEYYNQQHHNLGSDFLSEVVDSIGRITEYPDAWQSLTARTRRCVIHRFPYGIIYQIRSDIILVIAISNLHRKPTYWQDRISD